MALLDAICEYLTVRDVPETCDLIFVLAGRPERKPYGLELFHRQAAPRLILSVGRFEARQTAELPIESDELLLMRANTDPGRRHFFVDITTESQRTVPAHVGKGGTFGELCGLAEYVKPAAPRTMAIVSTSIHLRRAKLSCGRIPFFRSVKAFYVPVPDAISSFQRACWWRQRDHWTYVVSEYLKLAAYSVLYR